MRKALFGTTALVTAGMFASTGAHAEGGIKLGLGGYMNNFFGVGDVDQDAGGVDDFNETGLFSDGEVWFLGETTLDNGLTFGANVQLEAFGDSDTIDEDFGYMEGGFGRFQFGSENTAAYLMQYSSPSVGAPINSGWVTSFIPAGTGQNTSFRSPAVSTFLDIGNDENTLTYFTPRTFGFQLGVSYQPSLVFSGDGKNFPVQADEEAEFHDGIAVGINFVESFGGVDIAVAGGYRRAEAPNGATVVALTSTGVAGTNNQGVLQTFQVDDIEQFSGGLNIGFAGFTIGGSIAAETSGRVTGVSSTFGTASGVFSLPAAVLSGAVTALPGTPLVSGASFTSDARSTEGFSWDAGISYGTGPWTFGVAYIHGEVEDSLTASGNDEMDAIRGGIEYAVGPGITASLSGMYADWENDNGPDSDGFVGIAGVAFGF